MIKVLHYSTHNEDCGIADYQQQYVDGAAKSTRIIHEYYAVSPNKAKLLKPEAFDELLKDMKHCLESFDLLHIQHEFSFFNGDQLEKIISSAHQINKKVIVTVHTAPNAQLRPITSAGLHPRTILHTKRTKSFNASRIADYFTPLKKADAIIVHNQVTLHNLEELGIPGDRIKTIVIPVPNIDFGIKSNVIAQKLNKQKGDIIYATVGFISESKGVLDAIKALKFLPENYKLAIIGGIHPTATNADYLNALTDVILQLNLQNRVFITGYVKKMDELNALIRECDICVYPFDVKYYAYVSSASLTSAIGNYKPIVAYPTPSFIEVNQELPVINLTSSPSYYELARSIAAIDRIKSANLSEKYAKKHAWDKAAISFETVYTDLIASEL